MRLITRRDTSLVVALVAGTLIAFERPFRSLLDLAHDVEQRYHIDLLPALTLLTVVFMFHLYGKRVQAKAEIAALALEVAHTRARTVALERLMALGQTLASAIDRRALEQALWRSLPSFIDQRECSIVARGHEGVDLLLRDTRMARRHSAEALEKLVDAATLRPNEPGGTVGVQVDEDLVIPLIAGESIVGSIIVRNDPPMDDEQRLALGAAGAVIGVAARNARLLHDALRSGTLDGLTGCVTRAHGLELLERELKRSRRSAHPLSVIMFDIDRFKQINDLHGHLQGDSVLSSVGAQLGQILRSTDVRCRYGGDEFLLILPDTPILGAQQVAECLRRHIGDAIRENVNTDPITHGNALRVSVSLGVACAQPGELGPTTLIARADEALYRAKGGGRDRWCATANSPEAAPPVLHATAS